MQIILDIWFF